MKIIDFTPTTGQPVTAANLNEIKSAVNTNADALAIKFGAESFPELAEALLGANASKPINPALAKAMIAALSPNATMQTETAAYATAVAAAGGVVEVSSLFAFDSFIVACKAADVWNDIVFFAPLTGRNMVTALQKLKVEAGGVRALTNTNLVEADYKEKSGFVLNANSVAFGKFIGTGCIPSEHGVDSNNIGMGSMVADFTMPGGDLYSRLVGLNPASGDTGIMVGRDGTTRLLGTGAVAIGGIGANSKRLQFLSIFGGKAHGYYMGTRYTEANKATGAEPMNTEMTIFKARVAGNNVFSFGSIGGVILTKGITQAKAIALNDALFILYAKLGRIDVDDYANFFLGDSNTTGVNLADASNRFSELYIKAVGETAFNAGYAGSTFTTGAGLPCFFDQRQQAMARKFATSFLMYGTNDMDLLDNDANGNAAFITAFGAKYEILLNELKIKGVRTFVLGLPWMVATRENFTKQAAYNAEIAQRAANVGFPFFSVFDLMNDTGNPAALCESDGIHLNLAGHALLAKALVQLSRGQISRNVSLDFPSIASGASADLTLSVPGAKINDTIELGLPTSPTAGISYSVFVGAADSITVRATNLTAAAIDPGAQRFRVTLFFI